MRELNLWCPALRIMRYRGSLAERAALRDEFYRNPYDVIVSTYDMAISMQDDRVFFRRIQFGAMVCGGKRKEIRVWAGGLPVQSHNFSGASRSSTRATC